MSTLFVDDVAGQGGGTATNLMNGLAKMLAVYDQVTPGTLDSENVSSITDESAGNYTVNFTNNFGSSIYNMAGVSWDTQTSGQRALHGNTALTTAPSASACGFGTSDLTTYADVDYSTPVIFGDLA